MESWEKKHNKSSESDAGKLCGASRFCSWPRGSTQTLYLMYTHEFEDRVFRQAAYWVHKLDIDIDGNRIFLELIANPETQEYDGVIKFREIQNLEIQNFDENLSDNYIASLLGILDHNKEVGTQYLITTDLVEISFITEIEPEVNWADPDKPKQEWKREKLTN